MHMERKRGAALLESTKMQPLPLHFPELLRFSQKTFCSVQLLYELRDIFAETFWLVGKQVLVTFHRNRSPITGFPVDEGSKFAIGLGNDQAV
jgi:hypothetical protein